MNVKVVGLLPVTDVGATVADPDPSGAYVTDTVGDTASPVSVPAEVDFSDVANVAVPDDDGDTTALDPPPAP